MTLRRPDRSEFGLEPKGVVVLAESINSSLVPPWAPVPSTCAGLGLPASQTDSQREEVRDSAIVEVDRERKLSCDPAQYSH